MRIAAETLFWDERKFNEEMRRSPVRYRLEKARAARWLGRLRLQRLARAVVLLVITSFAIQLATLPLMALYFNRVSPVGVLLNVMAGLLTGFLMLAATVVIAIGALSASLAGWLATFCRSGALPAGQLGHTLSRFARGQLSRRALRRVARDNLRRLLYPSRLARGIDRQMAAGRVEV